MTQLGHSGVDRLEWTDPRPTIPCSESGTVRVGLSGRRRPGDRPSAKKVETILDSGRRLLLGGHFEAAIAEFQRAIGSTLDASASELVALRREAAFELLSMLRRGQA